MTHATNAYGYAAQANERENKINKLVRESDIRSFDEVEADTPSIELHRGDFNISWEFMNPSQRRVRRNEMHCNSLANRL
jgi:hypothetical protein